jgi:hypothetical protein
MGFNVNEVKLLLHAKQLGVNFEKVVTIGRQVLHLNEKELKSLLVQACIVNPGTKETYGVNVHAEKFLSLLGSSITDSLDASDYEGATLIQDLNVPLEKNRFSKYSLLIDGGSLEHVFNFPVAVKNCMDLIETGGYYMGITPTNNFLGHGFYQFSPELYYRIFSEANGFKMVKMYLYADRKEAAFYEVTDPLALKQRVTMANAFPSYLFVLAQKTEEKIVFQTIPQQSDYEHIVWNNKGTGDHPERRPGKFLKVKRKLLDLYFRHTRDIGNGNPQHIRRIDLNLVPRE